MIRICLNFKSQGTKKIEVFSQGTDDLKNLRCEILNIGDYEYANISSGRSLGRKVLFFSPSGFVIRSDFDYRASKIKFYSVRALKYYLNEKNLIYGRVTATISKLSP